MKKFNNLYTKIISEMRSSILKNEPKLIQSYAPYNQGDWIISIKRYATSNDKYFTWEATNKKTNKIILGKETRPTVTAILADIEEQLNLKGSEIQTLMKRGKRKILQEQQKYYIMMRYESGMGWSQHYVNNVELFNQNNNFIFPKTIIKNVIFTEQFKDAQSFLKEQGETILEWLNEHAKKYSSVAGLPEFKLIKY